MLIYINNESYRVFMESFMGTKFKIKGKNGYFNCCKNESYYHLENNKLKHEGSFVNYEVNNGVVSYNLSEEETKKTIKTKREKFDIMPTTRGGYAYIYHPSIISMSMDKVTRISYDSTFDFPEDLKESFSKYCLIPSEKIHDNGVVMEEYDFCRDSGYISRTFKTMNMFKFIKKFRNLYEGIELFEKTGFFHGDISVNNIVFDSEFKFIDYDFSLFYRDNKQKKFSSGVLYYTMPIVCNMVINNFFEPGIPSHNNNEESFVSQRDFYSKRFRYGKFDKVLIDNLSPSEKDITMFRYNKRNHDKMFTYIGIYQLTVVLLFYVNKFYYSVLTENDNKKLNVFFDKVLNFKKHGFIDIKDTLKLFDSI